MARIKSLLLHRGRPAPKPAAVVVNPAFVRPPYTGPYRYVF